jgi:hypothetical protein
VAKQIVEHHLEAVTAVVSGMVIHVAEPVVVAVVVESDGGPHNAFREKSVEPMDLERVLVVDVDHAGDRDHTTRTG